MRVRHLHLSIFAVALALSCGSGKDGGTKASSSQGGSSNADETAGGTGGTTTQAVVNHVATNWVGNCENFESDDDTDWKESSEVSITLKDGANEASGEGVTIDGNSLTITKPGNYRLSGTLKDGRVVVKTSDTGTVRLILDDAHITSSVEAALHVVKASKAVIILPSGSDSSLTDSSNYSDSAEANGALFSQSNLVISGKGALTVHGNYADGIVSKDGLSIRSGTIYVSAVDDGVRGKDCLIVHDGNLTINSGGDALKADNENDVELGYISLKGGNFDVTAGGDGVAAQTTVYVTDGKLKLVTGGGSEKTVGTDSSAKGLKGLAGVVVDGGTFEIDSADDGIHTNGVIYLNGGTFNTKSGDDGVHSDSTVDLNGATLNITKSYEGVEGTIITVSDGNIHVVSSDDGFNASDGSGANAVMPGVGMGSGGAGPIMGSMGSMPFGTPPNGFSPGGMPGNIGGTAGATGMMPSMPPNTGAVSSLGTAGTNTTSTELLLAIHGGKVVVDAAGDGLDSNGNISMTGGTVLVNGPTDDGNGPLDIGDGGAYAFYISGGFLVAVGSSGMAIAPSLTSTQNSVFVTNGATSGMGAPPTFGGTGTGTGIAAGTLVHIQNADGLSLLTYAPPKRYASIVFSSPELDKGTYTVYTGGTCSGTLTDHLYTDGNYTDGNALASFALDSSTVVTASFSL
jgi:hypothetical protein